MFPRLARHPDLLQQVVSLVKEDACIADQVEYSIRFEEYLPSANSFRITVHKNERLLNLLESEHYEDTNYAIRVESDLPAGVQELGEVQEAKVFRHPTRDRSAPIAARSSPNAHPSALDPVTDFLNGTFPKLSRAQHKWDLEGEVLAFDADVDCTVSLKYWVIAQVGVKFSSVSRRPARKITVKLSSGIKQTSEDAGREGVMVRLSIKDDCRDFTRVLKPGASMDAVDFFPRSRRPLLEVAFSCPGGKLERRT